MNSDSFNTNNTYIWNFGDNFLVKCPKCHQCAHVKTNDRRGSPRVRLTCAQCGHAKEWDRKRPGITYCRNADYFEESEVWVGAAVDWYFHLPLWLQIPCCGETLWAYNSEHLSWLKSFVSAKLRARKPHQNLGWSNQSLASRLPKWIKQKKHRMAVLQAMEKLERKVG